MTDRAYIVNRTLEYKIAIAENNNQNTLLVTLDVLKEIAALLKEPEEKQVVRERVELGFGNRVGICPSCSHRLRWDSNRKHCGECGQPLKWSI